NGTFGLHVDASCSSAVVQNLYRQWTRKNVTGFDCRNDTLTEAELLVASASAADVGGTTVMRSAMVPGVAVAAGTTTLKTAFPSAPGRSRRRGSGWASGRTDVTAPMELM